MPAPRIQGLNLALSVVVLLVGCATSLRDRAWLDGELQDRVGSGTNARDDADALPPGVRLDDGLDEHEVAAIALWRSPTLRAELTRIDAARATLSEARRPANPQVSVLGRVGPVFAVASLLVPVGSLWQLPRRARAWATLARRKRASRLHRIRCFHAGYERK